MSDEQMTLFDVDESTSSPEDTPASPSLLPGSKKALRTTATSGRQCLSLLSKKDPLGSLAKTLLVTSAWVSTRCFLTWKVKGTPQGRLLFQLAPSMPRTKETESGLLHTPTAKANQMSPDMQKRGSGWGPKMWATPAAADCQGTTGGGQGKSLRTDVRMWPTPQAADHKNMDTAGQKMRSSEVKLWPTPTAHNAKEGAYPAEYTRNTPSLTAVANFSETGFWPTPIATDGSKCPTGSLAKVVESGHKYLNKNGTPIAHKKHMFSTPTASDSKGAPRDRFLGSEKSHGNLSEQVRTNPNSGQLNPTWVEWLMGYPEGWTDLNH